MKLPLQEEEQEEVTQEKRTARSLSELSAPARGEKGEEGGGGRGHRCPRAARVRARPLLGRYASNAASPPARHPQPPIFLSLASPRLGMLPG